MDTTDYDYFAPSFWYGLPATYKNAANAAFRTYRPQKNFPGSYVRYEPNANSTPNVLRTYDEIPITDFTVDRDYLEGVADRSLNADPNAPTSSLPPGFLGVGYGGGGGGFRTQEEADAHIQRTRTLTGQRFENSEAFHGHADVSQNLFNEQNWQQAFDYLTNNVLTDDNLKNLPEYKQALSSVARAGASNTPIHRELTGLLPSGDSASEYDKYYAQLANHYRGLRDKDVHYFAQDFTNEINSAPAIRSPSEQHFLPFYGEESARRESENYSQALSFADNLDLGGVFTDFVRRLNANKSNISEKGAKPGGSGRTAFSGDLASASGVYQYLPNEELANQFNNPDKGYKGSL